MYKTLLPCLLLLASAAKAQTPVPVGADLQVNSYTTNDQFFARVATRANGDFVVVWESVGSVGSERSIQGQRFASDGSTLGGQFQVNSPTTDRQAEPAVAVDADDGDFVVVWYSNSSPGIDDADVQGQRFASDGSTLGGQFQVNSYTASSQEAPAVAVGTDGDFVVVWQSNGSSGSDAGLSVQGQRFASDGSALGAEFQVNSYTTAAQYVPDVAVAPDGDFVVVWNSSSSSVRGQRFASDGSVLGGEFQVNSYTSSLQLYPAVEVDPDGDFVVVWKSFGSSGNDSSSFSIQGRRFAADGSTLGIEFQVNSYTTSSQEAPAVAVDGGGHFVVVWMSSGSSGADVSSFSIQGQRFASDGSMLGGEFQVNSYTTGFQAYPSVAAASGGDFVVAWYSGGSSGNDKDGTSIQARRFTALNTPPVVTVTSPLNGETFDEGVAISFVGMATDTEHGDLSTGLAWSSDRDGPIGTGATFIDDTLSAGVHAVTATVTDGGGLVGQDHVAFGVVASAAPAPVGGPITPTHTAGNQEGPGVAADAAGRFVATWQSQGSGGDDDDGFSIQVQRYDSGGGPLGAELQVNTFTAGDQTAPAIGVSPSGTFVVAWQSAGSDGSGTSIRARRYESGGTPQGGDFQVNATTAGDQATPAVGVDGAGNFVVVWQSPAQDGNGLGVFAQRYHASGVALGGELQVNTYTTGDQSDPAISVDPAGDFLIAWQSAGSAGDDDDGTSIQARAFSAVGGALGDEVQVNATTLGDQRRPALCRFVDGGAVIAWDSEHLPPARSSRGSVPIFGIRAQAAAATALPVGSELEISADSEDEQRAPALTCRPGGEFLAVWQHEEAATRTTARGSVPIFNLRGAVFGATVGVAARLSAFFDLDDDDTDLQQLPAVASAGEDGFVAFWQSQPTQPGDNDLVGQRFSNPVPASPLEIFVDSFESGDTARWTTTVP